jgi:probable selenium-dependent hydroxylase accessory protein YqeC
MISLTGAGGKTTLMFRLARELFLGGKKVITTTTTKILEPGEDQTPHLFVCRDEGEIEGLVGRLLNEHGHITLAKERIEAKKLNGISPELANRLWNSYDMDALIIEADGAAGRPVKAPREGEPVIPSGTTLVVGLLGMDGVEKALDDRYVFRAERVSKITGIPPGDKLTEEGMALLIIHPDGLFKEAPASARRIAFLNKVDIPDGLDRAKRIAGIILEKEDSGIESVISGQVKNEPPVAAVFLRLYKMFYTI